MIAGESTTLFCPVTGVPEPEIIWMKNGQPIDFEIDSNLRMQQGGKELHIHQAEVEDGGFFTCVASNTAGVQQLEYDLEIRGELMLSLILFWLLYTSKKDQNFLLPYLCNFQPL